MPDKIENASLVEVIDGAAAALLDRANGVDAPEGAKTPSLGEQVKAFEAVAKWAEQRNKIAPFADQNPKESKFDDLRSRFHGRKTQRGRTAPAPTPRLVAGTDADPDAGRDATDGSGADPETGAA